MGQFFDQVQLPDWSNINTLFSPDALALKHNQALASDSLPAQAQQNVLYTQLKNDAGSQDLADRATLRGLAPGLASRNQNALATAASLPGVSGNATVNSLSTMDSQTAASKLAALQFNMGLPQMPGFGPSGISGAPPSSGSAIPPGMSNAESGGNPAAVNGGGYSGSFQFGTGRLTDLHMYQPAQGENPNGNQWQGTFNIPGFPDVKTHADFLQGPVGPNGVRDPQRAADAQRMAGEVHFKDIGQQIDNTPGAQDYDRNGLAAVAQLGGVRGMQQFVATGGKYNPHDSNGTSLQEYYQRFAQKGVSGLQQAFGHPDGPLPQNHPARGVQVASTDATAGMPATATDAVPIAGGPAPAPGSTVSDTPEQLQAKLAQMRANGASASTPSTPVATAPDQPAVDSAYADNMQAPTPGMGMPAPQAVAQARQELDASLQGVSPDVYNAAIQNRALQIINQSRQAQGSPALTAPAASTQQAPSAVPTNPPRPVIPGSAITTTAPFADQRFPLAEQGPSSQAIQQMPAGAQAAPAVAAGAQPSQGAQPSPAGMPAQTQQAAPGAGYDPMVGLPPGSRPIPTTAGTPYTNGAPAGFAWAQTPPSAQYPRGQLVPYPLVPPVLKQEKTATEILNIEPRTGAIVSRTPIAETGRQSFEPTPNGNQMFMNGHPVGAPIPFSGRPEQNEAYKADQKTAAGISEQDLAF